MDRKVYINRIVSFLPNSPISNDEMEEYIGLIGGNKSRIKSIVLRQNGIQQRYYALDKNSKLTHTNAQLAKEAIVKLFDNGQLPQNVGLLVCGTSTPDQLLPSHASMVHGELGNFPMEIFSSAGVCLTSLQALKICYSNILAGLHDNAVCSASELTSPTFMAKFYDAEYEAMHSDVGKNPYRNCSDFSVCFQASNRCYANIMKAYGITNFDYPDPRCIQAPNFTYSITHEDE